MIPYYFLLFMHIPAGSERLQVQVCVCAGGRDWGRAELAGDGSLLAQAGAANPTPVLRLGALSYYRCVAALTSVAGEVGYGCRPRPQRCLTQVRQIRQM